MKSLSSDGTICYNVMWYFSVQCSVSLCGGGDVHLTDIRSERGRKVVTGVDGNHSRPVDGTQEGEM